MAEKKKPNTVLGMHFDVAKRQFRFQYFPKGDVGDVHLSSYFHFRSEEDARQLAHFALLVAKAIKAENNEKRTAKTAKAETTRKAKPKTTEGVIAFPKQAK